MPDYRVPPQPWVQDALKVCGDDLMRDIVSDARAHNVILSRGGTAPAKDNKEETADRSGWREGRALKPPDGIREIDALCDHADAVQKLERLVKLAEGVAALQALKQPREPEDKT
jgi:hypothetical protein